MVKFNISAFESPDNTEPDLYNFELPLIENIVNLINASVCLPHSYIQSRIIATHCLLPSLYSSIAPILYLGGNPGTGKSDICDILSKINGTQIYGANTTYAGIRNAINEIKFEDPKEFDGEKNTYLVFDNLSREVLDNNQTYNFFLCGYSRSTEIIEISKGDGSNLIFYTYCPKTISTVHPLNKISKYSELARRLIPIKTKKFELLKPHELIGSEGFSVKNRFDPKKDDLYVFAGEKIKFWDDMDNITSYKRIKKILNRSQKSFTVPEIIDSHRWTISLEMICTGLVCDLFDTIQEAIDFFAEYWELNDKFFSSEVGILEEILKIYINNNRFSEIDGEMVETPFFEPKDIKNLVTIASERGELDCIASAKNISEAMRNLGYELKVIFGTKSAWKKIV